MRSLPRSVLMSMCQCCCCGNPLICSACGAEQDTPQTSPRRREGTSKRHEERVLHALRMFPDVGWHMVMRASCLSSTDAKSARDRLLAQGRIVQVDGVRTGWGRVSYRYQIVESEQVKP